MNDSWWSVSQPIHELTNPLTSLKERYDQITKTIERYSKDVEEILEYPSRYTPEIRKRQDAEFEIEFTNSYNILTNQLNSPSIRYWLQSDQKDHSEYNDLQRMDEKFGSAHKKYYELTLERKTRDFITALNHSLQSTLFLSSELNLNSKSNLSLDLDQRIYQLHLNGDSACGEIAEDVRNSFNFLDKAVNHYDDLQNLNNGFLYSEYPIPTFTNINTSRIKDKWNTWLGVRKDTDTIISIYNNACRKYSS